SREEAICEGDSDFKCALRWSPSSLLMAPSSVGGSFTPLCPSSAEAIEAVGVGRQLCLSGQRPQNPEGKGSLASGASPAACSEFAHKKSRHFVNPLRCRASSIDHIHLPYFAVG